MTKTYIGKEFAPVFYKAMSAWYESGCVGDDPSTQWQCKDISPLSEITEDNTWDNGKERCPSFVIACQYRWKPAPKRTVTIGYWNKSKLLVEKTLVAPETLAPKDGEQYWCMNTSAHYVDTWTGISADNYRLHTGLVFLSREDAQAMSDWLAVCRTGGAT